MTKRRPALVYLLTFLLMYAAPSRAIIHAIARPHTGNATTASRASSDTASAVSLLEASGESQDQDQGLQLCSYNEPCVAWAPPSLLNLDQHFYHASPAQKTSLRELEKQAIANVIKDHALTDADSTAVQTWGRDEALTELFLLLTQAIVSDDRTADQQNAVDWLSEIMKQKAISSAVNAGREYVRWAGLDMHAYETLLDSNPTDTQLAEFLNDTPQFGAYCGYAPPAPYSSDYSAAGHPICQSAGTVCRTNPAGCIPPTPSYEQFVKWGQAATSYELLNSAQFSRAARNAARAFGLAVSVAAVVSAGGLSGIAVGATVTSALASTLAEGVVGTAIFPFTGTLGAAGVLLGVAAIVILAIVIAVVAGIQVINASELPGQLAGLINGARTTPQDAKKLTGTTDGATTFFASFIGATLPEPTNNERCDNSAAQVAPGVVWLGFLVFSAGPPCLNPSPIPPPATTDPLFLVQAQGGTDMTQSPTISYRDAEAGGATTARLSKNWFITESNGITAQTLRIEYTDWDGKTRSAWLLGNPSAGYTFVTFAPAGDINDPADFNSATCDDDGTCDESDVLEYLGSDGTNYSAKVRGHSVLTGEPKFSPIKAAEGSPQSFDANGFSFAGAVPPFTFEWRFQDAGCTNGTGGCMSPDPENLGQLMPSYGPPVTDTDGDGVITHAWPLASTLLVELTATDSHGAREAATFAVTVENVPPTLTVFPDCDPDQILVPVFCNARTKDLGESVQMGGWFDDASTGTYLQVTINWGDGTSESKCINPPGRPPVCFNPLVPGPEDTLQLAWLEDLNTYSFDASHAYPSDGSYYGTVTVSDPMGGSTLEAFVVTSKGLHQTIDFPEIGTHTYGDAPLTISAPGGASGQPVSLAVTGSQSVCTLSDVADGTATLTLVKPGTCTITANQAGDAQYGRAAPVTQSFSIQPASLTITASSPTMFYGDPLAAITPIYDGFVGSDSADSLDLQLSCFSPVAVAILGASGGMFLPLGAYGTTCSAAPPHPNYTFHYMTGVLHVVEAATTVALMSPW